MTRVLMTLLFVFLIAVGCTGNPAAETVAVATATAVPTALPTNTTEPTATVQPTATQTDVPPTETATPAPTDTPIPSPTAAPTETPTAEPTATQTAAPTATQPPAATSAAVAPPPAPPPTSGTASTLREQLNTAVLEVNNYRWALRQDFERPPWVNIPTANVNCASLIGAHDRLMALFALDAGAASPAVQNAQNVAREGSALFNLVVVDLTDSCRQAVASGSEVITITSNKYSETIKKMEPIDHYFNQAMRMLDNE